MFGLFVNLTDELCVVVGGGAVGRRKALALRAAGASVRLVCLEDRPDELAEIDWRSEPYQIAHLHGAKLVFAAATADVNRVVVADARSLGIWVCDSICPDDGDFITPATVRRGEVVIALTTGVPALTRRLRQRLEETIGDEVAIWAALLAELRPRILTDVPAERRAALWEALTDERWPTKLRADRAVAWAEMLALVEAHSDA